MAETETMTEPYRTFHISGGAEPLPETLLGRISDWCAIGSIDSRRADRSVVELMRFCLACMRFDYEEVAECFGSELGRLIVESCYRDLVIGRYETGKRRIQTSASLMEKIYNGRQNEFDTERSTPLRLRMIVIEMPLSMHDGFVEKCDPSSREYALLKNGHCSAQKGWSLRASSRNHPRLR